MILWLCKRKPIYLYTSSLQASGRSPYVSTSECRRFYILDLTNSVPSCHKYSGRDAEIADNASHLSIQEELHVDLVSV